MKIIADFHVHSKFSRATARNLDFENLYIYAQMKGINVVGTGDFTHPGWFEEIRKKLVPAEEGLYQLKEDIAEVCVQRIPPACRIPVRFVLTCEISNIYKKNEQTRKNHNLVIVPNVETASQFRTKLGTIGNIHSDGRPILGLDAKTLLEILLETSDSSFLIPAHIWTPWFSVLGSKSGFDSIEECFEELSENIVAVETGLSSDPDMNWRVSTLDKYTLISNSDAHSPQNLGREANIFNTELSYGEIFKALKNKEEGKFLGTYEFYPEEGKYHLDGHRKCNVRLWPEESINQKGVCPGCGKPLTLGVLYRVEALADRPEGEMPEKATPYYSSIPLSDIIAEIFKVGPKSKKVQQHYWSLLNRFGTEFDILHSIQPDDLQGGGIYLLSEAITRMRNKELFIEPGYDGEFGKIQIFKPGEMEKLSGQKNLFSVPIESGTTRGSLKKDVFSREPQRAKDSPLIEKKLKKLNKEQQFAVHHKAKSLLIVAGPGTGKTLTITHRIADMVNIKKAEPQSILAVTFTNKAAREMRERITEINSTPRQHPMITTFHGLCYKILKELDPTQNEKTEAGSHITVIDENERRYFLKMAIRQVVDKGLAVSLSTQRVLEKIISLKQMLLEPRDKAGIAASGLETDTLFSVYEAYQAFLFQQGICDFEDLILKVVKLFERNPLTRKKFQQRFRFIFVDEFQDINYGQHRLLHLLSGPDTHLCAIGDPNQAIYGFRGSDVVYFKKFISEFPETETVKLTRNYRSTGTIVKAASRVISGGRHPVAGDNSTSGSNRVDMSTLIFSKKKGHKTITILEASSERAEGVMVGKEIERMVGGTGFHYMDFGKPKSEKKEKSRTFSDFAILYRTGVQGKVFTEIFKAAGIPYQNVNRNDLFSNTALTGLISLLRICAGIGSFYDIEKIGFLTIPPVSTKALKRYNNGREPKRFSLDDTRDNLRHCSTGSRSDKSRQQLHAFYDDLYQLRQQTRNMSVQQQIVFLSEKTKIGAEVQKTESLKSVFDNFVQSSGMYGNRVTDFLVDFALQSDTDIFLPRSERVALMTMHAAKGLEFPVVFVCGCENGYIPFARTAVEAPDTEEERRLFYVAMTRAKERLFLTYAKRRKIHGKKELRSISPFVQDLDEKLKEYKFSGFKNKKSQRQMKLF